MERHQYESLNSEEQEKCFRESPFKERAELIFSSHEPEKLTQGLTPEELYLVTREMEAEEFEEIALYATIPQLVFLADVDCWKGDEVDTIGFIKWIEKLLRSGEERLLLWLDYADYEALVSGFKKLMHVLKPEWEYASDEVLKDKPFFTFDEYYHIYVREEDMETVRGALQVLYEQRRGKYTALLEGVMCELDGEIEETAYQRRQARFADRGFPDIETARELLRPLSQEEFEKFPLKNSETRDGQTNIYYPDKLPNYPVLWSLDRMFLDDVLVLIREEAPHLSEGIQEEFIWLSNKMIASKGIANVDEETIRSGIERVRCWVNIGLEILSGGDLKRAAFIIRQRWVELILRWGLTRLFDLRKDAEYIIETYWKAMRETMYEFLSAPYEGVFRGVLGYIPRYYDAAFDANLEKLRDFRNIEDISNAKKRVDEIVLIHKILSRILPDKFSGYRIMQIKHNESNITLFTVIGTIFAHYVCDSKASDAPLGDAKLRLFLKEAFVDKDSINVLKDDIKNNFLKYYLSQEEEDLLKYFWALVFKNLEEELRNIDPEAGIDKRFISTLLI